MPQQPIKGFLLALNCTLLWAALPIGLDALLAFMPASSIVWLRFLVAAIVLGFILYSGHGLPHLRALTKRHLLLIIVCSLCLSSNFYFNNLSLKYITPTVTIVSLQIMPFLLIAAGWLIFHEPLTHMQKLGAAVLVIGLLLFFNRNLPQFFDGSNPMLVTGLLLSLLASFSWVFYAIVQKFLIRRFRPQQILWMIYIGCLITMTPTVRPHGMAGLDIFAWCALIFCCANTVLAYGSYAQAVNYWDLSKIGAVTATEPIFTILLSNFGHWLVPERISGASLNAIAYVGVFVVIAGAILATTTHKKAAKH